MSQEPYEGSQPVGMLAEPAESAWTGSVSQDATEKSILIDQAYDEYCRRRQTGEAPDPDSFCQGFPYQSSLRRLLEADRFLQENPHLLGRETPARFPEPGAYFLGFILHRELGRGTFARVFLATQPALGHRRVAVKIALQGGAEAETLGRLEHPNIVSVHSVQKDPASGLTAVCMPYLGGANLCHLLDRSHSGLPTTAEAIQQTIDEARPADEAHLPARWTSQESYVAAIVRIGEQLADGLACIHAEGICHRDLKPSNVLLAADGRAMLLDFNLSFDAQASEQRLGGTLPYMSPEHLAATDLKPSADPATVDARSDLFSLGVLLYELLGGAHPFGPVSLKLSANEVRAHLRRRHLEGPRPLRQLNPRVNTVLARVIERCLAPNPADRPQSAAELSAALRTSLPILSRARRWLARHMRPLAAVGLIVVTAGAAGAVGAYNLTARPVATTPQELVTPQELAERGRDFYRQGQFGEALECLEAAFKGDEKNCDIAYALGRTHEQKGAKNGLALALSYFQQADELYSAANGEGKHFGPACASSAYCLNRTGHPAEAIEAYKVAIRSGYDTAEVENNLGYSCIFANAANNQQGPQAELALDRAIQLNPKLQAAYYNRAMLHAGQAASQSRARPGSPFADLEEAIRLDQDSRPGTGRLYYDAAHLHANVAAIFEKRASTGHSAGGFRIGNAPFETVGLIVTGLDADFHHEQAVQYARAALQRGFNYESVKRDRWLGPLSKEIGEPPLAAVAREIELRLLDPVPDPRN